MLHATLLCLILSFQAFSMENFPKPQDDAHPGSETTLLDFERFEERFLGRTSVAYLPKRTDGQKAPLLVFGHGQALGEDAYDATLKHLSQKGVAALFVKYDSGFFDQDWRRMASDFNQITRDFLEKYQDRVDKGMIIYSGHSKGGYVALMAAGAPNNPGVRKSILFAPAGFDREYIEALDPNMVVSIVWGGEDTIIKKADQDQIYNLLPVEKKQFITVKSYPDREADHYFIQNKKAVFGGGQDGVSVFHYHGVWKWLVGSAWDLEEGGFATSQYVYGDKAIETGSSSFLHEVRRSWSVPQDMLVKFKMDSLSQRQIQELLGDKSQKITGLWHQVWLTPELQRSVSQNPQVALITPNHKLKPLLLPNDFSTNLWHFQNELGFDLNAPAAWAIETGSQDVVVGVVDSGIHLRHSDLADNIWENQAELEGQTGVDDDNNGYVDDIHGYNFASNQSNGADNRGHGTMVSGAIGAIGNNNSGIVGMAWSVHMMSLNMFPNLWGNATLASAVKAIDYAVNNGARIINASWGQSGGDVEKDPGFEILFETIERANKKGVLFVAAAGNDGGNNDIKHMIPATLGNSNILSVGAYGHKGVNWSKSNHGAQSVHVFAPGEEILTTSQDGGTRRASGTSLSAPFVSGLAALMLSINSELTPQELIALIESSCRPHTELSSLSRCGGFLDAEIAVKQAVESLEH